MSCEYYETKRKSKLETQCDKNGKHSFLLPNGVTKNYCYKHRDIINTRIHKGDWDEYKNSGPSSSNVPTDIIVESPPPEQSIERQPNVVMHHGPQIPELQLKKENNASSKMHDINPNDMKDENKVMSAALLMNIRRVAELPVTPRDPKSGSLLEPKKKTKQAPKPKKKLQSSKLPPGIKVPIPKKKPEPEPEPEPEEDDDDDDDEEEQLLAAIAASSIPPPPLNNQQPSLSNQGTHLLYGGFITIMTGVEEISKSYDYNIDGTVKMLTENEHTEQFFTELVLTYYPELGDVSKWPPELKFGGLVFGAMSYNYSMNLLKSENARKDVELKNRDDLISEMLRRENSL